MLTFRYTGADGFMVVTETLTSGMVGKEVKLEFSSDWDNLTKTAVFSAGGVTRDVVGVSDVATIPAEVLAAPMQYLYVGVYGVAEDGKVTPTIRARGPKIQPGADPSGDESTDPTLPVWAQLDLRMANLEENGTGNGSSDSTQNITVEPAESDVPKIFFGAPLQQTKDEIVTTFSYRSKTLSFDCYAEIKAQGNSTLSWPKKNQTVKLYADADYTEKQKINFKGWGKQNKFVIKANWRDLTHTRDIVSVRLEGDCMRTRSDFADLPELLRTSPNLGGIDGFPVVVYAAGVYQGRYTWNIPKDKWMANMDDDLDEHCILCSEDYNSSCFRAAANINGADWTDEIHNAVPASIKTRWNEVIGFVMNSTDAEFVENLDSYINVNSLIDRHIMGLLSCDYDGYGKNQLYLTYDGQQWYASRYDKDGTWGNYWTGSTMLPSDYGRDEYEDMLPGRPGNLLFIRLEQLFWPELQSRWAELRGGPLSIPNVINRFRDFYDITPNHLIAEDYASTTAGGAFTGIPNKTTCTIQQIQNFVTARHAWMDGYINALTIIPCEGISLSVETLTFTAEGTQTLTATVTPDGCTDPITWESDNTSIATVANGVVTTIANGSATITATCGAYSASCAVSVSGMPEPVPCTGITLDKSELSFTEEGSQTIVATVTPADTTDPIVWSSDNESVATVADGVVTSITNGEAIITASCGAYSASCNVTVSGIILLYQIPEATTFDGVDDYIDTGVRLLDTAKDFTILLHMECENQPIAAATVFHCMEEVSPYPGLCLMGNGSYTHCRVGGYTGTEISGSNYTPDGEHIWWGNRRVAIVCESGVPTLIKFDTPEGTVTTATLPSDATFTPITETLILGAYQDANGDKGRFWAGTLNDFTVYNYALTEEEVDAYFGTGSDDTEQPDDTEDDWGAEPEIVYQLPETTTFDGTNYIDTNVQLFDTDKAFTLYLNFAGSSEIQNVNSTRMLCHCMHEISPWPGLCVRPHNGQYWMAYFTGNGALFAGVNNTDVHNFAVTKEAGSNVVTMYCDSVTGTEVDGGTFTAVDETLLLGAYRDTSDTKGRFWLGTIYDCKVYNYALTADEITALMG